VTACIAWEPAVPAGDQWQDLALCAETDPEAFFPEKGGSTREAKKICLGCEVCRECLEFALSLIPPIDPVLVGGVFDLDSGWWRV
jgi:hypothetical protein